MLLKRYINVAVFPCKQNSGRCQNVQMFIKKTLTRNDIPNFETCCKTIMSLCLQRFVSSKTLLFGLAKYTPKS